MRNCTRWNPARFLVRVPAAGMADRQHHGASAIEALGMSLPNSSAQNAISPGPEDGRLPPRAGAAVVEMLRKGIRPQRYSHEESV